MQAPILSLISPAHRFLNNFKITRVTKVYEIYFDLTGEVDLVSSLLKLKNYMLRITADITIAYTNFFNF